MYTILVVGAGYVGREIARDFVARKQRVFAVVRTEESARDLEREKVAPLVADLTQPRSLTQLPPAHFIVIGVAPESREASLYRSLYVEGVRNFLKGLEGRPRPLLLVYLSSTGVWENEAAGWVDESVPPAPVSERGRILLEAERQVFNSGFPAVVFRLAGIYGPGRNRVEAVRRGEWPVPTPDRFMNMIHRDDVAAAIPVLFKKAAVGSVVLGVDDEPVLQSEFYRWLAQKLGCVVPAAWRRTFTETQGRRYRNERLKSMGFSFKYPSFREGYDALLASSDPLGISRKS